MFRPTLFIAYGPVISSLILKYLNIEVQKKKKKKKKKKKNLTEPVILYIGIL
ncbi:hypothetical protein HanXRQr2_Chr01g0008341 [Helianthus annuus]|uniref:Uncharacterized protein n=1 Tax=Helianthus annuus TaxID=4232 RepID=A0A9K3JSG8_HELAN|nr:hypothetical protein HanXRQr2_Chr01g0008341 [Helianthus annuus]